MYPSVVGLSSCVYVAATQYVNPDGRYCEPNTTSEKLTPENSISMITRDQLSVNRIERNRVPKTSGGNQTLYIRKIALGAYRDRHLLLNVPCTVCVPVDIEPALECPLGVKSCGRARGKGSRQPNCHARCRQHQLHRRHAPGVHEFCGCDVNDSRKPTLQEHLFVDNFCGHFCLEFITFKM